MNIPYRVRLRLQWLGTLALLIFMVLVLVWFCWVLWLERFVIYNDEGAFIDFRLSSEHLSGVVATPPKANTSVEIYYNEGENAIETQAELTQIAGYYVTVDDLVDHFLDVRDQLLKLPNGTPVMLEMKSRYGIFYYPSEIPGVQFSQSVNVEEVKELIGEMKMRGLHLIARVPALRDFQFALREHNGGGGVGLPMKGGYLWMDPQGYYWLNPTNATTLSFLTSIIIELKDLGFAEVVLGDFRFPDTDKIIYNGDKAEDLAKTAQTLVTSCSTDFFTVSFIGADASFPLPEGRCRLYLENITAQNVGFTAAQANLEDPEIRLVFIAITNDTRYDEYSVLRPLEAAEVLENQN